MLVVVADQISAFEDVEDPFGDVVRAHGDEIRYAECDTVNDVIEQGRDADILIGRVAEPFRLHLQ